MVISSIATAFNFLIILWKFNHERYIDAILDFVIFVVIALLFAGTITGLQIGMIASMLVSLYLLINPPKINTKAIENLF